MFALVIVSSLVLTGVSGNSVCLSCKDAVHPHDCTTVTTCGAYSACYTDAYITDIGSIRYNLGCRDLQQCAHPNQTTETRSAKPEEVECSECCSGDLCNNAGCNQYGYPPRHSRGPICYSCPRQQGTSDCQVIAACGRDEVCKLKRMLVVFGATQEIQYETMCEYKQKCEGEVSFYSPASAIGRRRSSHEFSLGGSCMIQCCTDDLCNTGCGSHQVPTTYEVPTTVASCQDAANCGILMSSYDVCQNPSVAQEFCPRRCGMCPDQTTTTTTTVWPPTASTTTTTWPPTTTTTTTTPTTTTMSTTTTGTTTPRNLTPGPTGYTSTMVIPTYGPSLAKLLYVGAHVVKGKDWKWGTQDKDGEGVLTEVPKDLLNNWVRVRWSDNSTNVYRMGKEGKYDLMLVPGSYNPPSSKR